MMGDFFVQSSINCQGKLINLEQPKVMGIVNVTPDSFFEGSRANTNELILSRVSEMLQQGADIIDLGAYSSRPGAQHVSESEEWERLKPALDVIRSEYSEIIISVDTFRSKIAERCITEFGVNIINDISAGELDNEMFDVVAENKTPYIMMHMKGTPQNMQENPSYEHIINEMLAYFVEKQKRLQKKGAVDIIIDPGFGFAKTLDHNYEVLARLDELQILGLPILAGLSRKSMIYKYLNKTPEQALNGTVVLNNLALAKGAKILRVHDVEEAVELIKLNAKVESFRS